MPALAVLLVFALTLFTSAFLLFLVQPMVGKMVTPLLGGTPAVWNTCMVFFQALLLAGYAYSHVLTTRLRPRTQVAVHVGVLLAPLAFFPLVIDSSKVAGEQAPVYTVLLLLTTSVGIPFFVVSTSAPLLQKWFAGTDHPAANDPYFLYAASNVGSMLALLGYPGLFEPWLRLATQRWLWCSGYCALTVLIAVCAAVRWRATRTTTPNNGAARPDVVSSKRRAATVANARQSMSDTESARPADLTWRRRLRWLVLAAIPSSLTLAATTYISTDIAAIPLLWVVPLAIYLLTFILVFARRRFVPRRLMTGALPPLALLLLFSLLSGLRTTAVAAVIGLHLVTLFVAAMVCHGELADDRPPSAKLTEFFLWVSLGGVLGGAFNALVAPVVFDTVAEYYLALLAVCLLVPASPTPFGERRGVILAGYFLAVLLAVTGAVMIAVRAKSGGFDAEIVSRMPIKGLLAALFVALAVGVRHVRHAPGDAGAWLDLALPAALAVCTVGLSPGMGGLHLVARLSYLAEQMGVGLTALAPVAEYGLPIAACWAFVARPMCFRLGVGALLFASWFAWAIELRPGELLNRRGFFGVLRVAADAVTAPDGHRAVLVRLRHGSTVHGLQLRDAVDPARDLQLRSAPLAYYHRSGPVGRILAAYGSADRAMGVIGLGTGSLAGYAKPGQRMVFYDIDPLVRDVAIGPKSFFTFAADARARGANLDFKLGDARLVLEREPMVPADRYGLLVVDAFSSDAIPVHLLTRQAFRLYMDHLREDGILCVHISNRFLDLRPVISNIAAAEGLTGLVFYDTDKRPLGKNESTWVAIARRPEYLARLPSGEQLERTRAAFAAAAGPAAGLMLTGWETLAPDPHVGLWEDDYCDLLSVLYWFRTATR